MPDTFWQYTVPAIAALMGSGALVALFKLRPERDNIITEAAERAVSTVRVSMETMHQELGLANAELAFLREERAVLRHRIDELERKQEEGVAFLRQRELELLAEIEELKHQITLLKTRLENA